MSIRVDVALVEKGLASSRARAQELIAKGRVFLIGDRGRQAVAKASQKIAAAQIESLAVLEDSEEARFVSRGGLKMQGALAHTALAVGAFRVLDVGISTGGFTDCLLQAGAAFVVGVDVGHGQLADRLKADPRVRLFEGVNARQLDAAPLLEANAGRRFDLVVVDVSFISLTLVLPEVIQYLGERSALLALVKPQFEVGREGLGKNGIVKDPALFAMVEEKIRRLCKSNDLTVEDYFASSIDGADGNREFFLYARPAQLGLRGFDSSADKRV